MSLYGKRHPYQFGSIGVDTRRFRVEDKKRTVASFEFENGKVAFHDFDSEHYRSPIRKNTLKIQGIRGEIIDQKVYYLDENNEPQECDLPIETFFSGCNFSQDETAIARLMQKMVAYIRGSAPNPYPLEEAIQDAIMGMEMNM